MVNFDAFRFRVVLNQGKIPVAIRRGKGFKLHVKLPYAEDNRQWLQQGLKTRPHWLPNQKFWELPSNHFNSFVQRALEKYRQLYVIQPYREQETCAPACWNAIGHVCQCSCMGANHGSGNSEGWFEVSDTFAFKWSDGDFACRLMSLGKGA